MEVLYIEWLFHNRRRSLCFRVAWEILMENYGPRHTSVVLWYNTVCVCCKPVHTSLYVAQLPMTTKLTYLMTAHCTPNDGFTANNVPEISTVDFPNRVDSSESECLSVWDGSLRELRWQLFIWKCWWLLVGFVCRSVSKWLFIIKYTLASTNVTSSVDQVVVNFPDVWWWFNYHQNSRSDG